MNPSCVLCGDPAPTAIPRAEEYFYCGVCDVRFLNPALRLSPSEEKIRYDLHRNDENDPRYHAYLEPLFTALQSRVPTLARGLDYGAGPGPALAGMFSRADFRMSLYDPYYHDDNSVLSKQYQFICSSEVAEHFYCPLEEFKRLRSLLEPGGWLGIMTQMLDAGKDFADWHYRRDPTHVAFYSPRCFQWIGTQLNFANVIQTHARVFLLQRPGL